MPPVNPWQACKGREYQSSIILLMSGKGHPCPTHTLAKPKVDEMSILPLWTFDAPKGVAFFSGL